ncbi:DUF222 domain-containing protein [Herbiconiux sp. KACC 21604]|uniref:HNH endonuclease signature motif containing protein n=1 Tax=unclassified Herbiconiux TaxID=2618217 RepID=UPI0014914D5C|nr:HNH endonuclease signature motif containing protein [Herbiconiux sp. SALV-R1]QJU54104.1 DUF222 domain-containing protein [Herbiconiux sp. SALV-R1]WPO85155.1 DUF222 domain-containing protein [Herbiconiux sp. KACC 21604]
MEATPASRRPDEASTHPLDEEHALRREYAEALAAVVADEQQIARAEASRTAHLARAAELGDLLAAQTASAERRRCTEVDREWARRSLAAELCCLSHRSERTIARLLNEAESLVATLPSTVAALAAGSLSYLHARALLSHARTLPDEAVPTFEAAVLPDALALTPARFDERARRLREHLHPESLVERTRQARADRGVWLDPERDGMATLHHHLDALDALAIHDLLDRTARSLRGPDEPRTHLQLRSDVLRDLLLDPAPCTAAPCAATAPTSGPLAVGAPASGAPASCSLVSDSPSTATPCAATAPTSGPPAVGAPASGAPASCSPALGAHEVGHPFSRELALSPHTTGGTGAPTGSSPRRGDPASPPSAVGPRLTARRPRITPTVVVTIPAETLSGAADTPADLLGYGPIDATSARHLAARATSVLELVRDRATGAPLSFGRTRYVPPASLRTLLQHDDRTCRFPGCSRSADHCELDHTLAWEDGGTTDPGNLAHLCPRHHHLKHSPGWSVAQHPSGSRALTWTTPSGSLHTTTPPSRLAPRPAPPPGPSQGSETSLTLTAPSAPSTNPRHSGADPSRPRPVFRLTPDRPAYAESESRIGHRRTFLHGALPGRRGTPPSALARLTTRSPSSPRFTNDDDPPPF